MGIINSSKTDPNKILPMTYPVGSRVLQSRGWPTTGHRKKFRCRRTSSSWKSPERSSPNTERRLIVWNLGFFSTAESLTANNIVLAVYQHITNPEARQYLLRQAYEEAIHTDTFIYCCDTLGLDPDEIYNMYNTIPSIKEKDDYVVELTKSVFDPELLDRGTENIRKFVHDLIGYYVIMEGIFFYAGFAMMLALKRQNKMIGIGEQFEYIMRDESLHLAFGCDLINTIRNREPRRSGTDAFKRRDRRVDSRRRSSSRKRYAWDACPEGLLGINAEQVLPLRRVRRPIGVSSASELPKLQYHRREPVPVDVSSDRSVEGEELLRDPGDGVPDGRGVELGLEPTSPYPSGRQPRSCLASLRLQLRRPPSRDEEAHRGLRE